MKAETRARLKPASLAKVVIDGGFWWERQRTNRKATIPVGYEQLKRTGRIDALKLDWKPGRPNEPHRFWDSDVAKWIEAAASSLALQSDTELETEVDALVDLIAKAQQPDGYLNVHYTVVEPEMRWKNLLWGHELYCAGHLIEAALAYHEATGKRRLLDVVRRYADHINAVFGRGKGKKRGCPGHEEIELALVKLYHATGESRYLDLSKYFLDERGREPNCFKLERQAPETPSSAIVTLDQFQAHLPVRNQKTAGGHAVRAMYLYAGMADVAAETRDKSLLNACKRIWMNITTRRMYVTGGVGSMREGERFTFDYDLPNETAYAETCAAIGLIFFAHRMLHLDLDGKYADVMERCLYNGVLSGVSLDGKGFFYTNPLAVLPEATQKRAGHARVLPSRVEWFSCSCCPPNIARLIAQFGQYVYSQGRNELAVHLYAQSCAELDVRGKSVILTQKTDYPWKERIRLSVRPERPATFTLALRIPGWVRGAKLSVNGKRVGPAKVTKKGYAKIRRQWKPGDRVELTLPMPVERVEAHPAVRNNCGRVALMRGPLVYCLEEADNGQQLRDIALPREARLTAGREKHLLGGVVAITGKAGRRTGWAGNELYRPLSSGTKSVTIRAVPYYAWGNRKPGEMLVWIREV